MKETEKRISEYRKALPRLKEKVLAAALMLVVSVVTMTASTFAWLTISRKPEVSGVATTISGNGNLEIALSDFDGLEPEESEVGDSGKNIIAKNITWGNLVNLSNEQYGLKNLTLRPATLNETALATNPLRAAVYGADGRVSATTADFAFTIFDGKSAFKVPETTEYGVKAISSVGYTYPGGQGIFDMRVERARGLLSQAQDGFKSLCSNANITPISGIIGEYVSCMMVDRLKDDGSKSLPGKDFGAYMSDLHRLMGMLNDNYLEVFDAAAALASIQLEIAQLDVNAAALMMTEADIAEMDKIVDARMEATADDAEMLLTTADVNALMAIANAHVNNLKSTYGIEINGFNQFLYDYYFNNRYLVELAEISAVADSEFIGWPRISHIINFVVDVPTTEVEGHAVKSVGLSAAQSIYGNKDNATVIIKKGAIKNLEQFIGQKIQINGVKVTVDISEAKGASLYTMAKMYLGSDRLVATGNISTEVTASMYQMPKQLQELESGSADSSTKVAFAQDTYGMAIDIWLRTNMENCYLTLEGNILTKQEQKTDDFGNLYFKHKENSTEYYKDKEGIYYDSNGKKAEDIDPANDLEIIWVDVVIGYEGENRIWDEDTLSDSSMTQGSGSCYVFYSDSPTEEAQSLELMKAMKVAFIDDEGTLLAVANMDADSYFAEGGRVTVPLVLDEDNSIKVGEDVMGNPIYAIAKLGRGVSTRITALIYIDGYQLDNKQVLSADSIQGQLNIQFGTSAEMVPVKDEDLYQQELNITAEVTPNQFTFVADTENESTVRLIIGGYTPSEVKASFVRQINSSQGTKQEEITFTGSGANWEGIAVFKAPGTYILRTVWLDGIEYTLKEPQTVQIDGYSLNSIRIDGITDKVSTIRTTDSSYSKDVYVQFAGDLNPEEVQVQVLFMNEDNQSMLVDCDWDGVNWAGKVTFPTSGTYHMRYYLVDGEYYEISESLQKTIILQMGLKVKVTVLPKSVFTFSYDKEEQSTANSVNLQVQITDNNGVELTDFEEVNITYKPTTAANASGNKLYAELTWNDYGYYEGSVQVGKPGAYEFYNMFLDGSYITSGSSPVIRAVPPEPPSYEGSLITQDYIFTVEQKAEMGVAIAYSNGTEVRAVLTKVEGEGAGVIKTVTGSAKTHIDPETGKEVDTIIDWYFALPKNTDTADNGAAIIQQGKWKISELLISGVIIDEVEYTEEEPLRWDMSDKNLLLEVANDVIIEVTATGATPYNSTTNTGINQGTFLSSYSADLQIKMHTYKGGREAAIPGLSDVKLAYNFNYSDYATGAQQQYVSTDVVNKVQDTPQEFTLSDTDGDLIYTMNASISMPYAGTYSMDYFSYKIGNVVYGVGNTTGAVETISKPNGLSSYKVKWTTPTVKIVGTSPAPSTSFKAYDSWSLFGGTKYIDVNNSFSNNECTVYIKYESRKWHPSSVILELSGAGTKYTSAEMYFKGTNQTWNGEAIDATFTFPNSSTGTVQKTETWGNGGTLREPAGTERSNELTMYGTVDGKTIEFLFKVTEIILNNPK